MIGCFGPELGLMKDRAQCDLSDGVGNDHEYAAFTAY